MAQQTQPTKKAVLVVTAPKDLLRGVKMIVQAELDVTWRQFLRTDLQLRVTHDMYVSTATYTANLPPGTNNSWRFELDEKIGDFIAKFERRRTQYVVRIRRSQHGRRMRNANVRGPATGTRGVQRYSSYYRTGQLRTTRAPSVANSIFRRRLRGPPAKSTRSALQKLKRRVPLPNGANNAATQQTSSAGNSGSQRALEPTSSGISNRQGSVVDSETGEENGLPQIRIVDVRTLMPPPPPPARRQVPVQLPRQNEQAPGFSGAAGNSNHANQLVPLNTRRGAEFRELDDDLSVVTSATAEERELRLLGIEPEDIRARVEERVSLFPNSFMLRMRQEVGLLRRSGRWLNTVEHCPLTCYFVQEMFNLG